MASGLPLLGQSQDSSASSSSKDASTNTVDNSSGAKSGEEGQGREYGNYRITQSITFGGHIVDFSGNPSMWSTLVNVTSGPRLLENSFDMRSLQKQGTMFDELSFHTFGFGGDPNNLSKFRMAKYRWYRFDAQFRRDRNYFDYDLLANPLNPPTSVPNVPVLTSPHVFATVRRLYDYTLTLRPESDFRVRLGYSRNSNAGPSYSSVHVGTDALLLQNWRNTVNSYQMGFDWKFARHSSISYDQFLNFFKGDTNWGLDSTPYLLSNGVPVSLGLPFNTANNQPCAVPLVAGVASATCPSYKAYQRGANLRGSAPTEQLSLHSNYVKWLDVSGRLTYTGGDNNSSDYGEFFQGLRSTNSREVQWLYTGPSSAQRVAVTADLGLTIRVNEKFRIMNTFRWWDFRLPGSWTANQASLFAASSILNPNPFTPATCPAPYTAATCPQHASGSNADASVSLYSNYFGQDSKTEQVDFMYDFNRHIGARVGFRYRNRNITGRSFTSQTLFYYPNTVRRGSCTAAIPLNADGTCTVVLAPVADGDVTEIHDYTGLFGLWFRPTDQWNIHFDLESGAADKSFTRISPRKFALYRTRVNYAPISWANFAVALDFRKNSNQVTDVNNKMHNWNYAVSATFMPQSGRFGLDLSYEFTNLFSQTNICYVTTPAPPGVVKCGTTAYLSGLSVYQVDSNFGQFSFFVRPVKKLTVRTGYSVSRNDGSTLIINPLTPTGPLNTWWQHPMAAMEYAFHPNWTGLAQYNYQDYHENSDPGPTAARNTRGNIVTLAIRYAF